MEATFGGRCGADLLEGEVAVVVGVEQLDGRVEGDGHADAFVGSEGQHSEDENVGETLSDFDCEGAISAV
jgi:hypothetical protein